MTQPTLIFFGPDTPVAGIGLKNPLPKIYLRTLLFSTSKRGRIIENMHIALSRNETHQNFSIWVYGEDKLMRGSGLFVGETGITVNHHFLAPIDATGFQFTSGRYRIEVFAHLLGKRSAKRLFVQELELTSDIATQMLTKPGTGVFFNWGPDSSRYYAHTERSAQLARPDKRSRFKTVSSARLTYCRWPGASLASPSL